MLGGDMTGKALVPIVARRWRQLARDLAGEQGETRGRGGGGRLRGRGHSQGLLPLPHRAARSSASSLTTSPAGTQLFHQRDAEDGGALDGPRGRAARGQRASAASSARGTTTSSTSTRSSLGRGTSSSPKAASWSWTGSRWRPRAGRTSRRGTPTVRRTSRSSPSGSNAWSTRSLAEPERTIFSFHCPPYNSGLDGLPSSPTNMDLKDAGRATKPVGSTAVRQAIEDFRAGAVPPRPHPRVARRLARIGRTLCINPGSSYQQGDLPRGRHRPRRQEEGQALPALRAYRRKLCMATTTAGVTCRTRSDRSSYGRPQASCAAGR